MRAVDHNEQNCGAFSYLAADTDIVTSEQRLADILEYSRAVSPEQAALWMAQTKQPHQVFWGLKAGSLVSLVDQMVFEPTHPAVVEHYNPVDPLADHLR